MVQFTAKAKVVGKMKDELIKYSASIKSDGSRREAGEFRKVYCSAVVEGDIAVLRFDMRHHKEVPSVQAGQDVVVTFNTVTIENDVTQINVAEIAGK